MIRFALSTEARAAADLLQTAAPGAVVTFEALSRAIGRDAREARHLIRSGERVAQREAGVSFANVRGTGYRRLRMGEVPAEIGGASRKRIRGEARRAEGAITAAVRHAEGRQEPLSPAEGRRASAELAALGLIQHLASERAVRGLGAAAKGNAAPAATAQFLEHIGAR